ncbi:MAG: hypothetical protein JWR12_3023 [Mucilaginibacter sp.]|nr:hypothetical protein [Mucilaginibacter sp.]
MPVQKNIYELRSAGAQEILNRPPVSLILWGNTVILFTLVISLLLTNVIKLPVVNETNYVCTAEIPYEQTNESEIILETNFSISLIKSLHLPVIAQLVPQPLSNSSIKYLSVTIDTAMISHHKVYFKGHTESHFITSNSLGKISFKSGEETILKRLVNKITEF